MEVTHESRRKSRSSSSRWGCRTEHGELLDVGPEEVWTLVITLVLKHLSEEFDWRLGTELLNCRHVDIVNEDHGLVVSGSPIALLGLLHQLAFDVGLGGDGVSLR